MKKCARCQIRKDKVLFYKNRAKPDGYTTECIECTKKILKKSLEKRIKDNPQYYKEHYARYKDSIMKSQLKHAEKMKARSKITRRMFYLNNIEEVAKKCKTYRELPRTKEIYRKNYDKNFELKKPSRREYMLKRSYGITTEEYEVMNQGQDNKCLICKKEQPLLINRKGLVVDHCHKTGKVRGLLCNRCNLCIGQFGDNHVLLQAAADYLKSHADT